MPDVLIIGAGHNALVTAFYLAKAGLKPLVLERSASVGGAAVTDEFYRGFKCSTLAHAAGPVLAEIAHDMRLERNGLEMIEPVARVFAPAPDGSWFALYSDLARSVESIARLSPKDAQRYGELDKTLKKISGVTRHLLSLTPPSIDGAPSREDAWKLLKTGRGFRKLGRQQMFQVLRWGPMAVADFVAEWFETDLLRAAIAARGIFGTAMGPWSAGSTAVMLLRAAADPHPGGVSAFPRGGMGALTAAMAAAARAAGAEIRTGAEVRQIGVKNGVATGVTLTSGEEIQARAVVSGADPRRTYLKLVDPVHFEPAFVVKMRNYRSAGTIAKVNLALDGVPEFSALGSYGSGADRNQAMSGRIHIGPGIDYLERAFDASKYGEFSPHPYLDISIPSLSDSTLAPVGKHVMSICAQYAPYKLKDGDWNTQRGNLADAIIRTLAIYAPRLPEMILGKQIITPLDLEEKYGLTGGHPYHGELALDQLFTMRPVLEFGRYRAPIKNLFLCGSGTHPGTGVTGASGANAAREILKDLRK
ncbi:MAG: NAD(P)/FAD-dependent oxidoreductase [Acidipila sp.]|nr:NAD(P)/FAD-dependent oxidoreductase [Acidipila sp.]